MSFTGKEKRTHVKKWTPEQEAWLLEHKDVRGKMRMYDMFMEAFPGSSFTANAISSKRTELGAYGNHRADRHGNARPLYSETKKKGYTLIKVAKYEWWPKNRWVWVATHPGEPWNEKDNFVFLDGDNGNFSPDNIIKVSVRVMGIVCCNTPLVKGDAKGNYKKIVAATLKLAMLDAGEKLGMTYSLKGGRAMKVDIIRRAKEWRERFRREHPDEYKRRYNATWLKIKKRLEEDPAFREEYRRKARERYSERKKRGGTDVQ